MSRKLSSFYDPKLDAVLVKWLCSGLSQAEIAEWKHLLARDAEFREGLCDWIKALREPNLHLLKKHGEDL